MALRFGSTTLITLVSSHNHGYRARPGLSEHIKAMKKFDLLDFVIIDVDTSFLPWYRVCR